VDILGNQVHPMVQMLFPNSDAICQYNNLHTNSTRSVQFWFEEHEDALKHLPWPAKSPDLTIIKLLWSVLESMGRHRFPPKSFLKQLEDVLLEEGYNIQLENIQNLYESIPRRIHVVLQANVGPNLH
jgi:hypothetical protein